MSLLWQTGPLRGESGFYFVDTRAYHDLEYIIVIHTFGTSDECTILTNRDMNYGGCPILLTEDELKIAKWAGPIPMPEAS
jgi:hypothetical protein